MKVKKNTNIFKEIWIQRCLYLLIIFFGKAEKNKLYNFLSESYDMTVASYKVRIYNNYRKLCTDDMTISQFLQWYFIKKPIATAGGTLFKRQDQARNILADMLDSFLSVRKIYKKKMLSEKKGTFLFKIFFRKQINEKVNANAFYGCLGAPTSYFYNYYLATSVTSTGQVLISMTHNCFERFVADNVPFLDMNDMFEFIYNVLSEKSNRKYNDIDIIDINITKEQLVEKLISNFYKIGLADVKLIEEFVDKLNTEDINRLYYKNNLQAFCKNKVVSDILTEIINSRKTYNNPSARFLATDMTGDEDNGCDTHFRTIMYDFKNIVSEYVMYEYMTFDRIFRARRLVRKSNVHMDTDSNMICVDDFYNFMNNEYFKTSRNDLQCKRSHDDERYFAINIMSYLLSDLCDKTIQVYCKQNNIMGKYRDYINMKNEYLYKIMLFTNGKKHYAAIMELQEGNHVPYDKQLDMKGIQLRKVVTNEFGRDYFTDIIENDILRAEKINRRYIVDKYTTFEKLVVDKLKNGDLDVCKNMKVKPIQAYAKPFEEQSIKGMIVWNCLYEETNPIIPIEYIYVVITTLRTLDDMEPLKTTHPEIYETLKHSIFEHPKMKKYGAVCIGIKKDEEKIPEWIIPFINFRLMMRYNASPMMEIWESLGLGITGKGEDRLMTNNIQV